MNALEENPYLALTREFNDGEIRAIICSGQAVVLHGLAVIGELSRNLANVEDVILWSRSARDLIELGKEHREALEGMISERPLLIHALNGDRERLGAALDKERRDYMELNERRISAMQELMIEWRRAWPSIVQKTEGLPLREAHNIVTEVASKLLPSS